MTRGWGGTLVSAAVVVEIGHIIAGKYRVDRVLGIGGMGMVVGATHLQLERRVALKFMLAGSHASPTATARFLREGKAAVKLRSEHVCQVLDVGTLDDGAPFIVMEMLDGVDLARIIQQRAPLAIGTAVDYVMQALEGVATAHASSIVHRDLKPSNLFVTIDGTGAPLVKVLDFGIAKSLDGGQATHPGDVIGSPAYMAPEQVAGQAVDPRTDVWAIGVILYQAVTGHTPYAGDTLPELRPQILSAAPRALPPELPLELSALIMRCLEKDPADRFQNVADLAAALTPFGALDIAARATRVEKIVERRASPLGPTLTSAGHHSVIGRAITWSRPVVMGTTAVLVMVGIVVGALVVRSSHSHVARVPRGGTIHVAIGAGADGFDLFSTEKSRSRFAVAQVVESLFQPDAVGEIRPWLIDRYELKRDTNTLTLHLRSGVWFHDHPCFADGKGRLATGDDVAYSLRQDQKYDELDLPIQSIEVQGNTVQVHLSEVTPFFEGQLTDVTLLPTELEGCEDLRNMKQPVGTGPFRFATAPRGIVFELVRAPHYWRTGTDGKALPYLDGISVEPLIDLRSTVTRLSRHELDLVMPAQQDWPKVVASDEPPRLVPQYDKLDVSVATRTGHGDVKSFGLYVGKVDGPLRDVRVRRALALGLDRNTLLRTSSLPFSGPAYRFLQPNMIGYDETLKPLSTDLDTARALVRDAGPVRPIRIGTTTQQPMAAEIAREAAAIGLTVEVVDIPPAHIGQALDDQVDAMLMTVFWALFDNEPSSIIEETDRVDGSHRLAELQRVLLETPDRKGRERVYRDVETVLLDELPMIPIGWGDVTRPDTVFLIGHDVRGFHDPLTSMVPMELLTETFLAR